MLSQTRIDAFKTLITEVKGRSDAGKLSQDELGSVGTALQLYVVALRRAGIDTKDLEDKAAAASKDPQVVYGLLGPAAAKALADFEASSAAGAAAGAAAGTGAAAGETAAAAGETAAAAGETAAVAGAAATVATVVVTLVAVALVIAIIWIIVTAPDPRADRLAPKLLEEAIRRVTDAIKKSKAREAVPKPPVPIPKVDTDTDTDTDEQPDEQRKDCEKTPADPCKPVKIPRKGGSKPYTKRHNRCADKVTLPDNVGKDMLHRRQSVRRPRRRQDPLGDQGPRLELRDDLQGSQDRQEDRRRPGQRARRRAQQSDQVRLQVQGRRA